MYFRGKEKPGGPDDGVSPICYLAGAGGWGDRPYSSCVGSV